MNFVLQKGETFGVKYQMKLLWAKVRGETCIYNMNIETTDGRGFFLFAWCELPAEKRSQVRFLARIKPARDCPPGARRFPRNLVSIIQPNAVHYELFID